MEINSGKEKKTTGLWVKFGHGQGFLVYLVGSVDRFLLVGPKQDLVYHYPLKENLNRRR